MSKTTPRLVSVAEAATEIGVSVQRIRQLLGSGEMVGFKVGAQWAISEREVKRVGAKIAKTGRPRGSKNK